MEATSPSSPAFPWFKPMNPFEAQGRILNLTYLVYAPSMKKRKVMMELESSLRSVRLQ
jgi:hypothetical protein